MVNMNSEGIYSEGISEEKQMDLCLTAVRFSTLTDLGSSKIHFSLWCYSQNDRMFQLEEIFKVFKSSH